MPCILFLDEIDSLCGQRSSEDSESSRRVKNEILLQLDRLDPNILLIAATNMPQEIDSAVRRRFEKRIYVDLPDQEARRSMLNEWIVLKHVAQRDEICDALSRMTDGYSGSDIKNVCQNVNYIPIQKLKRV